MFRIQVKLHPESFAVITIIVGFSDPPYITAPQSLTGHMHDSLTISCRVESLVPVTVTWLKDAKRQNTSSL